mgnify:CR=1 FL=1
MKKTELTVTLSNDEQVTVHRVNNDQNGNPRYVIHYSKVANNYDEALKISRKIGGKVYTAKWYGGGLVFSTYNLQYTLEYLLECAGKLA